MRFSAWWAARFVGLVAVVAGGVEAWSQSEVDADLPHTYEEIQEDPGCYRVGVELSAPSGIDFQTSWNGGLI